MTAPRQEEVRRSAGDRADGMEELRKQLVARDALLAEQDKRIAQLLADNAVLRQRLEQLERQIGLNSSNSGKPPSSDGPGKPSAEQRTRSTRGRSGKRSGGQPGHRGATLQRTETPDRVQDHLPTRCDGCGAVLSAADTVGTPVARQVFDLPEPQPLEVTEHWGWACLPVPCLWPHDTGGLPGRRIRQRTLLCIQDGTDLNFAEHGGCRGLGYIGKNQRSAGTLGLHMHSILAGARQAVAAVRRVHDRVGKALKRGLAVAVGAVRAGAEECRRADRWLVRASDDLARAGRAAVGACERLGRRLLTDRQGLQADRERIGQALEALRPQPVRKEWKPPRRERVDELLPSFPPRGRGRNGGPSR